MALNASVEEEGRGAGRRRMRVDYYFSFLSFGQLRHFFSSLPLAPKRQCKWLAVAKGKQENKGQKGPFSTAKADVMATAIYHFFRQYNFLLLSC